MKLYDGGRAPNPRRVRVFLAEKGIAVPLEEVDMQVLAHKSDAVTRLNPMQQLPVLELDDGTILTETVAICRYFEKMHPEPPLMGIGAEGEAIVEMWQRRMEFNLFLPVAYVFRHSHPAMKDWEVPQVPEFAQANRPKVLKVLNWMNDEMEKRDFVAGDSYTIADITAMIAVDFMKPAKIEIPENLTYFRRWYDRVKARPSADA